jgi:predicted DNA binding CopG/RHH family protein
MEKFKLLDKRITFRLSEKELNALERIKGKKSITYSTIIRNALKTIIDLVDEDNFKNNLKDNDYENWRI